MSARKELDKIKDLWALSTDKELAEKLGTSKTNIDSWVKRNKIPEKWKLIIGQMSNKTQPLHVNNSTISIPKLSATVSAGGGNNVESIDTFETNGELIIDKETLRISYGNLKAMKVDGYSMVPVLLPDSWVIFDDTNYYDGDGLYVINFRNILMVKTLQVNQEGKLRIISANKDYESYTVDLDDQSVFRIFGKVRRCII